MAAASFHGRHGGSSGTLGVHAESRKIGKQQQQQERKPVIIYMVSPKVIHVEAHEFLPLVQRLTGPDSGARGDRKGRPSTSGGGGASSPTAWQRDGQEGARNDKGAAAVGDRTTAPPVRVKARALNRPAGAAVSVSVTATRMAGAPSAAPSPSGLMFHDLSPLRGAALKGEHPLISPGWLHHAGDHFLSPGAAAGFSSPSAGFLDIFEPLSFSQQQ
jgi:MAP kinase substrate 1